MQTSEPLAARTWPDMVQRSEAWFKARAGRPTASQFHRIITPSGNASAGQEAYAIELIADSCKPADMGADFYGNPHTDRGNELEPRARAAFANMFFWQSSQVEEVGFITCDYPGVVGCSPDALVKLDGEYVAGLEIKCPLAKHHAGYLMAANKNGAMPPNYKQQVHGSMVVTGLDFWYFFSFCEGLKPVLIRVERDDYTELVEQALDDFVILYSAMNKKLKPLLIDAKN